MPQDPINRSIPRQDLVSVGESFGDRFRVFYEAAWRPSVGWICVSALGLHFVLTPAINVWLVLRRVSPLVPPFDLTATLALLTATLGMGGLRTFEKLYGVSAPSPGSFQAQGLAINQINAELKP